MAEHATARASGVDVWPQVSCRPLVFQMNFAEPFSLNTFPNFAALMDCPVEERTAAYRDPAWRSATQEQISSGTFSLFNPSSLSVAESTTRPDLVGRSVVELAAEQDVTPLDVLLDLSLADDLTARFWSVLANDNEEGIAYLLPRDDVLLGLADSGAHVSQLCDACFATDLLGNWVRDRQVLSLEHAIHKLTAEPARVYGLHDRGSVAVGMAADLVVFDPDTVAPGPLRRVVDFPAAGERLTADPPVGMTHTLVNGVPIRVDGQSVSEGLERHPGTVLRNWYGTALRSRPMLRVPCFCHPSICPAANPGRRMATIPSACSAIHFGLARIPTGEKADFWGVHVRQRCRADEHVVQDLAVDGRRLPGFTEHLPGRPDALEERLYVGVGHPGQPVAGRGALVHHDLVEFGMLGRKIPYEASYPVGDAAARQRYADVAGVPRA